MTICAWCEDEIAQPKAAAAAGAAASHGICRSCLTEELAKLRPTVAPMPFFASAPQLG